MPNDAYAMLVRWMLDTKSLAVAPNESEDLVDTGVLDSMFYVEYVLMIQELSNCELEIDDDLLSKVRSLQAVKSHFFSY